MKMPIPIGCGFRQIRRQKEKFFKLCLKKLTRSPNLCHFFLRQLVRIAALDSKFPRLGELIRNHGNDLDLYQFLSEYLPDVNMNSAWVSILFEQYANTNRRSIKNKIYQIDRKSVVYGESEDVGSS